MVTPARAAAFAALRAIDTGDTTLGDALARARAKLSDDRDRALVNEIVTGTLRHRAEIDYQLSLRIARRFSSLDADVVTALRLSAFQLLHLARVPPSAVVNDAVNLVRVAGKTSASGLANAVLRRLARERNALTWPERPATVESADDKAKLVVCLATIYSHPSWLVERWIDRHGAAATEQWLAFDNDVPALTLAVNSARTSREALADALARDGVSTEPTRVSVRGLRVTAGRALSSAAFRDGLCLVQDEASQVVAGLVPVQPGDRVLDACAAPGGKTVALAAMAGPDGLVVATDIRARRMRTLREMVMRCRLDRVRVVQVGAEGALPFAEGAFNRILVDAPCSGLGTLRRDPDIRWRREPGDLARFAEQQLGILARVAPLVGPGGDLVYSTCSSEPDENENVVHRFLASTPGFALRPIDAEDGVLRTLPFRDGLEAFFAAILHRAR